MATVVVALDSVTLEHCRYRCSECLVCAVQVQAVLYSTLAVLSQMTPRSLYTTSRRALAMTKYTWYRVAPLGRGTMTTKAGTSAHIREVLTLPNAATMSTFSMLQQCLVS
eukprot:14893-Heterococcus_DN1.PRE.2